MGFRVAGVDAVALGKHHPAPRVEAPVGQPVAARGGGAGPLAGADGLEAYVVPQVAVGQHVPHHRADQIIGQRCPVARPDVPGAAATLPRAGGSWCLRS